MNKKNIGGPVVV